MAALLLASFKTKREANRISRLIQQYSNPTRAIIGSNLEDLYLGEKIEEGMKEKGDQPIADFKKYLNKRIAKLSR